MTKVYAGLAALVCLATAASASAQDVGEQFRRDRNVSVRDRPRPDYDAVGIQEGSFLLLPKLTTSIGYDDNIYATNTDAKSDSIETVSPEIQAVSNWSRNAVRFYARGQYENYNDFSSETNTTYAVGGSGRYDISRDFAVQSSADYQHLIEPRTASGAPLESVHPIQYDLTDFDISGAKAFNRLRFRAGFDFQNYDYHNGTAQAGTTVDPDGNVIVVNGAGNTVVVDGSTIVLNGRVLQDYRDENIERETLRAEYALTPDKSLYIEAVAEQRNYRHVPFEDPYVRDSTGYRLEGGASFDLTQLMRGSVQVGYLTQNFQDPRISDYSGVGAKGDIQYFPTQLTTVTFRLGREIADSGLINSPAFLTTNVGFQVDHELLRNVIITGRVDYGHDDYRGIDREDDRYSGSAGVVYLLNRSVGLSLLYTHATQESAGLAQGPLFDINRITASLVLQR